MIHSINNHIPADQTAVKQENSSPVRPAKAKESAGLSSTMDTVSITRSSEKSITYTSSISPEELADKSYDLLRQLVTNMLKEQGIDFKIASGSTEIDISTISQEEAQKLIADDGYFGVEQTSDRIVDFAIAAAGGDIGKVDVIKEGVQKGFNEALEAFGGWLPEISHTTFDTVMKKLDAWADQTHE